MNNTNRKLKVLVMMLYWYPCDGPLMPIYGPIFKGLLKKGHQVTIVTSFPHFRYGRLETWPEHRGKLFEKTYWQGVHLVRSYVFAPIYCQTRSSLFYRALNFISFNISSVLAALFLTGRADVILAPSSPPLTNGMCAWIVSRFKKCPVVLNIQDMSLDIAVSMRLIKSKIGIGFLRLADKMAYQICTKVITISGGMAEKLHNIGVPANKIVTIENSIDPDLITPMPYQNEFSCKHDLIDQFVVMYAGNIGLPHGVEVIVKAAELLKKEKDICFCFVAKGENRGAIEAMAVKKKLDNTLFVNPQSHTKVPLVWASASVGLITYRKGLSDFSIPSKLLALLCAARPVIAAIDTKSETASTIRNAKCGFIVPPENEKALAEAILRLKKDTAYRRQLGSNGREYVKQHFQKNVITKKYEELFRVVAK